MHQGQEKEVPKATKHGWKKSAAAVYQASLDAAKGAKVRAVEMYRLRRNTWLEQRKLRFSESQDEDSAHSDDVVKGPTSDSSEQSQHSTVEHKTNTNGVAGLLSRLREAGKVTVNASVGPAKPTENLSALNDANGEIMPQTPPVSRKRPASREETPIRPASREETPTRPSAANPIRTVAINRALGQPIGIVTNGLVVERINSDGAASSKGLAVGDTIIKVNDKYVSSSAEINAAMQGQTEICLDLLPAAYKVSFADV